MQLTKRICCFDSVCKSARLRWGRLALQTCPVTSGLNADLSSSQTKSPAVFLSPKSSKPETTPSFSFLAHPDTRALACVQLFMGRSCWRGVNSHACVCGSDLGFRRAAPSVKALQQFSSHVARAMLEIICLLHREAGSSCLASR